ncbi:hypothetical protein J1605_002761 [Eschrichtius robustus]|uniref:Uncharacterized protein n=1 Tax=Eschrichtius robustus TaxID=9764 RepID=A0AB34HXC9_ESCRO|nr:hypothetical protein J1605_002761 [Eschrichtius robustus]
MSGTRLRASSSPASPTLTLNAGAPKTTLSVPIQWNVTAPNPSAPPSYPRNQSRVSLIAEFSHEPKLHHVRARTREVTGIHDSRPTLPFTHGPRPALAASPALGARTHPETTPQES